MNGQQGDKIWPWLKVNWFRAGILVGILLLAGVVFASLNEEIVNPPVIEETDEVVNNSNVQSSGDDAVDELKREIETLKQQKPQVIVREVEKNVSDSSQISSSEVSSYLTAVGEITCFGSQRSSGSGVLWSTAGEPYFAVLTNDHVITTANCNFTVEDSEVDTKRSGIWRLQNSPSYEYNNETDSSLLKLSPLAGAEDWGTKIPNLNYSVSSLRRCSIKMSIGSPVLIIGYPAFAKKSVYFDGITSSQSFRSITNGIISAHDTSVQSPVGSLPYANYFVSAKIDSGNSGGLAVSKDSNGVCLLGIPTWLSIGNFETQGLVQNIHNVLFEK